MFELTIMIPVADNSGVTFTIGHHNVFETEILSYFVGFTREPNPVTGGWRSASGVVYRDALYNYVLGLESIGQGSKVIALVDFAKTHYQQEAIGIRYLGMLEAL